MMVAAPVTKKPRRRPLTRYHGGKWVLGIEIIKHFPPHRIYTECFGGGGSVLLRKERSYSEIYNDLDGEIVNLFRVTRDRGEELKRAVELTPFSRDEFVLSYERSDDPVEAARRTLVRVFMGFSTASWRTKADGSPQNTGFRSNSNRSGTTPAHDWRGYPEALVATIERLRGVVIENRDALEVMVAHDGPDTLHYVDPPYLHSTRSKTNICHRRAYRFEMTDDDHRRLAAGLHKLRGHVVLSGYPSALYDELYRDWRRVEFPARADGARPRTEVLWIKEAAAA